MIVLDTNVVSELMRSEADPQVTAWSDSQPRADLHLTAISAAELGYGVARLPPGRRRDDLARRLQIMLDDYLADRVLPFDAGAAAEYGPLMAARQRTGRPVSLPDAQIAAICQHWGAVLATRDAGGFDGMGLDVVDPWAAAP